MGTQAWRRRPIKRLLGEGALGKDPKAIQRNPRLGQTGCRS